MNGIYLYFVNKHLSSWSLLGLQDLGTRGNVLITSLQHHQTAFLRYDVRTSLFLFAAILGVSWFLNDTDQ